MERIRRQQRTIELYQQSTNFHTIKSARWPYCREIWIKERKMRRQENEKTASKL